MAPKLADIPLRSSAIHIWLAFYDEMAIAELQHSYRQCLNRVELQQEPRFHFARDRRRYLVTRALVRNVLSRYVDVKPDKWVFATNTYGRPEVENIEARAARLDFNISHSSGLIVLGITKGRALGVDVEEIGSREVSLDIADRFFAPAEVRDLAAVPADAARHRFFEYWTFKESYIKARGMGLSLPLEKFQFRFPSERSVDIEIDLELADDAQRWMFWQYRPTADYLIAICAEADRKDPPSVLFRKITPLVSEQILELPIVRTSS